MKTGKYNNILKSFDVCIIINWPCVLKHGNTAVNLPSAIVTNGLYV